MKVLFPTDFSDTATYALGVAAEVARTYGAELVILHVIDPPPNILKLVTEFNEELAIRTARKMLDKFMAENPYEGVEMSRIVKVGKPFRKISEAASEIDPVMIVMGTQGASKVQKQFIGSNSRRVLKLATCPVIAVSDKPMEEVTNRILLPLDLTRPVKEKINFGIEAAKQFESELLLVSILPEDYPQLAEMKSKMKVIVNRCMDQGIKSTGEIISPISFPAEAILDYAMEKKVGMIAVMTQREHGFKDIIMGSTASFLVHHSRIPILAFRPKTVFVARRQGSVFG